MRNAMLIIFGLVFLLMACDLKPEDKWLEVVADRYQYLVVLPDSSAVILSKDAKVVYPREFETTKNIHIDGTAFVDARGKDGVELEIVSPHLITKVLEGEFFISDITGDSHAEVQMRKGDATVVNRADDTSVEIADGFSARYRVERLMKFNARYDEKYDWFLGPLEYEGEVFKNVVKSLENRFELEIKFDESLAECKFVGSLKNRNPDDIMRTIAGMFGAELNSRGKVQELVGGSCAVPQALNRPTN